MLCFYLFSSSGYFLIVLNVFAFHFWLQYRVSTWITDFILGGLDFILYKQPISAFEIT